MHEIHSLPIPQTQEVALPVRAVVGEYPSKVKHLTFHVLNVTCSAFHFLQRLHSPNRDHFIQHFEKQLGS